jgi:hypothetical protein
MRKRTIKLTLVMGVLAIGASFSRPPRAVQAAPEFAAPQGRVITRLVGQRQTITITSTSAGVRYSVAVDGKPILASATIDELRLKSPESFRQIQSSIASTSPQIWAGTETGDLDR